MLFVLCGIALLLLFIYKLMTTFGTIPSYRTIRMFNKLPGPKDLPFYFGFAKEIKNMKFEDFIPWVSEKSQEYDGLFSFYMMGTPTVLITEPDHFEAILTSNINVEKGSGYHEISDWLQDGLLLSRREKWTQRRKMLNPSFHFKILEHSTECMNRCWQKAVKRFFETKGAPFEPYPIIGRGALDIICETGMGIVLEDNEECEKYMELVKKGAENTMKKFLSLTAKVGFLFPWTEFGRQCAETVQYLHKFTSKVIQERKVILATTEADNYGDYEGKKKYAFLDTMLEAQKTLNLADTDVQEEVDTFMFAGHDTTSTTLNFLLLQLGENPDIQEKAYQEIFEILGYSDRDITREDLSRMHYLEQVIKEGMRLHPAAPQINRLLVEDVTLKNGMVIPAGAKTIFNIFLLHRNPKNFPEPDKFRPERFSPEESKNRHPYAYLPFSAGPRNCIGQKFAMQEMKIGLATVLRSCKITSVTDTKRLKYKMIITLQSTVPVRVEITPRF